MGNFLRERRAIEQEIPDSQTRLKNLEKSRQPVLKELLLSIQRKIPDENKAKTIAITIEEKVFSFKNEINEEYFNNIKCLLDEFSKPEVEEEDICRLSLTEPDTLELIIATISKERLFYL